MVREFTAREVGSIIAPLHGLMNPNPQAFDDCFAGAIFDESGFKQIRIETAAAHQVIMPINGHDLDATVAGAGTLLNGIVLSSNSPRGGATLRTKPIPPPH